MTLMGIENRIAGSQKIVGEGPSDCATLLSGFDSQQTHNVLQNMVYSPSHIAQITDFLDFLHEYCMEKPETFTEF